MKKSPKKENNKKIIINKQKKENHIKIRKTKREKYTKN